MPNYTFTKEQIRPLAEKKLRRVKFMSGVCLKQRLFTVKTMLLDKIQTVRHIKTERGFVATLNICTRAEIESAIKEIPFAKLVQAEIGHKDHINIPCSDLNWGGLYVYVDDEFLLSKYLTLQSETVTLTQDEYNYLTS